MELTGTATPDPGGGQVRLRIQFGDHPPQWMLTSAQAGGAFSWKGKAPDDVFVAEAVAWFAGNRTFCNARSAPTTIKHPPVVH